MSGRQIVLSITFVDRTIHFINKDNQIIFRNQRWFNNYEKTTYLLPIGICA